MGQGAFRRACWLGTVLLLELPAQAMQPCPPVPPVETVWPAAGTEDVPQDAAIFLQLHVPRAEVLDFLLTDLVTGARVESTLTTLEDPGFLLLRPGAPLAAGHDHELWAVVHGEHSRFGRPSPTVEGAREVVVARLIPVARRAGGGAPKLKAGRVAFGEWADADGNMAHLRAAGRDAELRFAKGSVGVAVVQLRGSYAAGAGAEPTHWNAALAFGEQLSISTTSGFPCAGSGPPRPPGPRAGTFELVVIPWSATGVVGTAVTVKGTVKTSR